MGSTRLKDSAYKETTNSFKFRQFITYIESKSKTNQGASSPHALAPRTTRKPKGLDDVMKWRECWGILLLGCFCAATKQFIVCSCTLSGRVWGERKLHTSAEPRKWEIVSWRYPWKTGRWEGNGLGSTSSDASYVFMFSENNRVFDQDLDELMVKPCSHGLCKDVQGYQGSMAK